MGCRGVASPRLAEQPELMVPLLAVLIPLSTVIGQESGASQAIDFTSLGVAGLICAVLGYAWIRTEKRLDAANELNVQMLPVLTTVQASLLRTVDTNDKTAETLREVAVALQRVPDDKVWTRVMVALEATEQQKKP